MDGILSDVKVLERAHAPSGAFCAKLLADQGADTIKVEAPGSGDKERHEPPFIGDEPHPERSTTFLALNTNKRGITLDVGQPAGKALFLQLARTADVVIESFQPGYLTDLGLSYDDLRAENPDVILLSISYFGQHGPYANY
ncbi:MAG: CoA transferase, partial [Burkholderiales bacterium]